MSDLFPAIEKSGWEVVFGIALGYKFNRPDQFVRKHRYIRKWVPLDGRIGTPFSRQRAIFAELQRSCPDVVMPIAVGDALPALRAFRNIGGATRILVPVHSLHAGTLADLTRASDLIDGIGVVSGLLDRWGSASFQEGLPRIFWIRNGVLQPRRIRTSAADAALRVGYVGRLENGVKRALDVGEIAAAACKHRLNVTLTVAGDGPAAHDLAAALQAAGDPLLHRVLGFVSRDRLYDEVYPNLDCLLVTSQAEGSPLNVIEAMRHGVVPVISRFHGHAADGLLVDGRNCLSFSVGDASAAANCLQRLARSPELRQRLSRFAVEDSEPYDTAAMTAGWLDALNATFRACARTADPHNQPERPIYGRLEKWGVPLRGAEAVRRLLRTRYRFEAGFDEWPGSLNDDRSIEAAIANRLDAIERVCAERLYGAERVHGVREAT